MDKAKAVISLFENGLTDLRNSGLISQSRHDELQRKVDAAQGVINAVDGKLDGKVLEKFGPLAKIATDALVAAKGADGKAGLAHAAAEAAGALGGSAGGWASWMPWLIGGAATGPLGLALAGLGLYRRIGRKAGGSGVIVTDDLVAKLGATIGRLFHSDRAHDENDQPVRQMPVPMPMPMQSHTVVVPAAPIVPAVRTEHSVVRVPDTDGEEALRRALKVASENGIINPGSIGAIENLARQILSGNSTSKEG